MIILRNKEFADITKITEPIVKSAKLVTKKIDPTKAAQKNKVYLEYLKQMREAEKSGALKQLYETFRCKRYSELSDDNIVPEDIMEEAKKSGVIQKDKNGVWRIISMKKRKFWPNHYKTKEKAQASLAAYHANKHFSDTTGQQGDNLDAASKTAMGIGAGGLFLSAHHDIKAEGALNKHNKSLTDATKRVEMKDVRKLAKNPEFLSGKMKTPPIPPINKAAKHLVKSRHAKYGGIIAGVGGLGLAALANKRKQNNNLASGQQVQ